VTSPRGTYTFKYIHKMWRHREEHRPWNIYIKWGVKWRHTFEHISAVTSPRGTQSFKCMVY